MEAILALGLTVVGVVLVVLSFGKLDVGAPRVHADSLKTRVDDAFAARCPRCAQYAIISYHEHPEGHFVECSACRFQIDWEDVCTAIGVTYPERCIPPSKP